MTNGSEDQLRAIPTLATARLLVRPFELADLDAVHQLLDREIYPPGLALDERKEWLEWAARNSEQLALLEQPPYGDRAVALKSGELIGSAGIVPYIGDFAGIPYFDEMALDGAIAEVGLFWAIGPNHRGNGYATEAASALVEWMFTRERLGRIIATTERQNLASQGVMRKLGMRVETNTRDEPGPIEVLGVIERAAWHNPYP